MFVPRDCVSYPCVCLSVGLGAGVQACDCVSPTPMFACPLSRCWVSCLEDEMWCWASVVSELCHG